MTRSMTRMAWVVALLSLGFPGDAVAQTFPGTSMDGVVRLYEDGGQGGRGLAVFVVAQFFLGVQLGTVAPPLATEETMQKLKDAFSVCFAPRGANVEEIAVSLITEWADLRRAQQIPDQDWRLFLVKAIRTRIEEHLRTGICGG